LQNTVGVPDQKTCRWCSRQEDLPLVFPARRPAVGVPGKKTCRWCSRQEDLPLVFPARRPAEDLAKRQRTPLAFQHGLQIRARPRLWIGNPPGVGT